MVDCVLLAAQLMKDPGLENWIQREKIYAEARIVESISASGTARGSVIASPSREHPDYFFMWIRDAAIVMNSLTRLPEYQPLLDDYIHFSRQLQQTSNPSGTFVSTGLGEPKFNVDGSPYTLDWGRPQSDGPALRAISLMELAKSSTSPLLYDGKVPTESIIKADLEYVAHHWKEPSIDLWEEVRGKHFFTLMVQRRALFQGAQLALQLGDGGAASFYQAQAQEISTELERFWNPEKGYILASRDLADNRGRTSQLDVAVILGSLLGGMEGQSFHISDERVLATSQKLAQQFSSLFSINQRVENWEGKNMGPAMGRYPEDFYNGYGDGPGNPWFLATLAQAEYYYRLAGYYQQSTPMELVRCLRSSGDSFLRRVRFHSNEEGQLDEQFNRDSGFLQGARHLTWSYAAFLRAIEAREAISLKPEKGS